MANELMIVDQWGEKFGVKDLNDKKFLENITPQQLENIAYRKKEIDPALKKVDEVLKERLNKGEQFPHICFSETERSDIDQSEQTKIAFVKKYGWDAVEVKSPAKLKRKYGEDIQQDLDKVIVYTTGQRLKYE
ncbi:hypothetical protein [Convivina praedatoris]|uniref:hypothetical protein n=1 Tax=Convivina praedatoris TaxID=2880963 RepID=UPI00200C2015|nr:hypothetical protein [Convivina sp. LMG 32447]CAH1855819.1 hypothetical protein R078138_01217 [Convivina sp. LMG 32447]